jgi:hypothetical protein
VAKLTEDQRQQRAAKRAQKKALEAEAEDQRQRERSERWEREHTRLTWEEFVAGEPCRGCGQPMSDRLGSWSPLMKTSEAEKQEYDKVEHQFRVQHPDCRAIRWGISGSHVTHCGFCCPPPPLGPKLIEKLGRLMSSWPSHEERKKDLDAWKLTLRCDHSITHIQHRDNNYVSNSVVDCPDCGERRGVVHSERVGPAYDDGEIVQQHAVVDQAKLAQELAAAERRLARQQEAATTTAKHIDDIRSQLL